VVSVDEWYGKYYDAIALNEMEKLFTNLLWGDWHGGIGMSSSTSFSTLLFFGEGVAGVGIVGNVALASCIKIKAPVIREDSCKSTTLSANVPLSVS
jgi:hypothetical protein